MIERVLEFGDSGGLVGTLLTADTNPDGLAVITFNAGIIPRTGPHRLWVKLARQLASAGISTLRFDLSGQGDSAAASTLRDFETQAVEDIRNAMSIVQSETGIRRFILIGICSGAALSYKTALVDPRVMACGMIDIYMYPTWRTRWIRISTRLRRDGILKVLSSHLFRPNHSAESEQATNALPGLPAQSALPGLIKPTPDSFAQGLQQLLDRQTRLLLIYTGSFLYSYNYKDQFSDCFRKYRLKGPLNVEFDPQIDHTVTEQAAQRYVIDKLTNWIKTI